MAGAAGEQARGSGSRPESKVSPAAQPVPPNVAEIFPHAVELCSELRETLRVVGQVVGGASEAGRSAGGREVDQCLVIEASLSDHLELLSLYSSEPQLQGSADYKSLVLESSSELESMLSQAQELEQSVLLESCAEDMGGCHLEFSAGAGGDDAMDFTDLLLRMYSRWCQNRGFASVVEDLSPGDRAGLRSGRVHVAGRNAHGWLAGEAGVHRLIRVSPFDSRGRRHTSFARVQVFPDSVERGGSGRKSTISASEIVVETFRSSGPGGQSVNTTDSAVRITHTPTGVSVRCQSERSQHQNRSRALTALQAKLAAVQKQEELEARELRRTSLEANAWSNQIRSYWLTTGLVKDHRTGYSRGNAAGVLEGDIDDLVTDSLHLRRGARRHDVGD